MLGYYLQSNREEEAVKCFESYVENIMNAEKIFKTSVFFGDLGEDIRFISNGTLVSLEAFRDEVCNVMQNPGYMKHLSGNKRLQESMEKLREYREGK